MSNTFLIEQIDTINNVFKNSLTRCNSQFSSQYIRTPLLSHQTSLIEGIALHHLKMMSGFVWNDQIVRGKLGIVSDLPGSGKTLSILSYLALLIEKAQANQSPNVMRQGELSTCSNRYFYSNHIETSTDISSTHLIIVPPHLFDQWKNEIDKHTTFTYCPIDSKRILRNRTTLDTIVNSSFVLTTSKCYRFVQDYAQQNRIKWKHIFIDEASSIHFATNDPVLEFEFLWLITNDWLSFLYKNTYISPSNLLYISDRIDISAECNTWLQTRINENCRIHTHVVASSFFKNYIPYNHEARSQLIVRNGESIVSQIPIMAEINNITIECRYNYSIALMRQMESLSFDPQTIPKLMQGLSITSYAPNEFVEKYTDREALIETKLIDDCSICLDTPVNRTLTTCCMNAFCGGCILRHMMSSSICPTCRSHLQIENVAHLPTEQHVPIPGPLLNKHDTCVDYIRRNPEEFYIIYTLFENTYYQLMPELDSIGITCERLEQNNIVKTVNRFNDGNVKVLFISNLDIIYGLSLTKATHLIFFYDLPLYGMRQLMISSANRLGRKTPLTVLHLRSEEM